MNEINRRTRNPSWRISFAQTGGGPLIVTALAMAAALQAGEPPTTTTWAKIGVSAGFSGWRAQFQHMADQGSHPVDHMCVVVATYSQPSIHHTNVWGYLYWRENNELYTLSQSKGAMDDLAIFKGPLNLKTDVVRTQREVGSSTFLVTRAWVNNILHHCHTDGDQLTQRKAHA